MSVREPTLLSFLLIYIETTFACLLILLCCNTNVYKRAEKTFGIFEQKIFLLLLCFFKFADLRRLAIDL